MRTREAAPDETIQAKKHRVQYPVSAYAFPAEALIRQVRFDDTYVHLDLTDGRRLSIPLEWVSTLSNAAPEEREKYCINASRTALVWDPERCAINDELHIADHLGPRR